MVVRLQNILEKQRTSLAQELHDTLAQNLTVLVLELSLMQDSVTSEPVLSRSTLHEKLKELAQIVNEMIRSLRKIIAELRPKLLDECGLVAALEWESEGFMKRTGLKCRLEAHPEELTLPPDVASGLFRMFREMLSNIEKHAQARQVDIEVKQDGSGVILRVTDDGKGIMPEQIRSSNAMGLIEIRERARSLGGELEIEGIAGKGTSVTVKVPLHSGLQGEGNCK